MNDKQTQPQGAPPWHQEQARPIANKAVLAASKASQAIREANFSLAQAYSPTGMGQSLPKANDLFDLEKENQG